MKNDSGGRKTVVEGKSGGGGQKRWWRAKAAVEGKTWQWRVKSSGRWGIKSGNGG
jgi:hypothetical protein